eukprot:s2780_g1.t1
MPDDGTAYAFTGKGFGKGKLSKNRNKVNAYHMDTFDYNGIEFEAQTAQTSQPDQAKNPVIQPTAAHGMLDCGATCSAGPERSIQNLVNASLAKDHSARVTVNGKNRPRFRYGSGQANGRKLFINFKFNLATLVVFSTPLHSQIPKK